MLRIKQIHLPALNQRFYNELVRRKAEGKKSLALLVDPDKGEQKDFENIARKAAQALVDFIFVGGSLITDGNLEACVATLKLYCNAPIVLFPGSGLMIDKQADAILLLSVISGRNPEMLIGRHVEYAPMLKKSMLEIVPTGYMLIESGKATSASYMSNTTPIPADKADIAACTAMAGEMLGLKVIFMDGGSGAIHPVSDIVIKTVSKHIQIPLIVGGGIRSGKEAATKLLAGADVVVVGNAIEKQPELLTEIAYSIKQLKS